MTNKTWYSILSLIALVFNVYILVTGGSDVTWIGTLILTVVYGSTASILGEIEKNK